MQAEKRIFAKFHTERAKGIVSMPVLVKIWSGGNSLDFALTLFDNLETSLRSMGTMHSDDMLCLTCNRKHFS